MKRKLMRENKTAQRIRRIQRRLLLPLFVSTLLVGCGSEAIVAPALLDPVCGEPLYAGVRRGDLSDKTFYDGYVTPDYTYVRMEGERQIGEVYKWIGDPVKEGDKLAEYDLTQARQKVEMLEREIAAREQEIACAKAVSEAQIRLSEAMRLAAGENVDMLGEKIEASRDSIQSMKEELKEDSGKSKKEKKEKKEAIKKERELLAGYRLQSRQEQEAAEGYAVEQRQGEVNLRMSGELDGMDLEKLREELKEAKREIEAGTLIAPCDGRVVGNTINRTDAIITPDNNVDLQGSVYVIAKDGKKYVTVYGLSAGQVPKDARVSAVVDKKRYELIPADYDTDYIIFVKEHKSKEAFFDARFTCEDPAFFEKLAMADFVNVCVERNRRENVLIAPRDAIYGSGKDTYVMRLNGKKQEKVPVEVGATSAVEAEMISGVQEGDTLLLKSVYFQTEACDETMLKRSDSEWKREGGNLTIFFRYTYPARPQVETSKVEEVLAEDGAMVKKGDILFKLKIPSVQSEIERMEYRLSCHDQDAAKEIERQEKEIRDTQAQRDTLFGEEPASPELSVLNRRIDYLQAVLDQTRAQLDMQRLSLQNTLAEYKAQQDNVYVRAGCDGEFGYRASSLAGETIKRSWGSQLGYVAPKGSRTYAIPEKGNLVYGQKVTVTEGTGEDAQSWEYEAILTPYNRPSWYDDDYSFSGAFQTVLYNPEKEPGFDLARTKASYVIRRYEDCYQVSRKMVFEDQYGSFVYQVGEGGLIKRYVTLTEYRDGLAVVLDGIDEDCTLIERRRE